MTHTRALKLRDLAQRLPLDSLVLETDAPDMPPQWLYRTAAERAAGQPQGRNTSAELPRIAQVLADSDVDIRRVDIEDESAMQTTVLRFTIAVHDQLQLESALRALRRNAAVRSCSRVLAP